LAYLLHDSLIIFVSTFNIASEDYLGRALQICASTSQCFNSFRHFFLINKMTLTIHRTMSATG